MDQKDLNGKYLLIENCPGIGDLIMCTPALRRLKEIFPHCILTIVSYENNLPIVSRLPYVDYVCGIKKGGVGGHFYPIKDFLQQDYCCFTTYQPILAFTAKLLGVNHRSGVCKPKYMWARLFEKYLLIEELNSTLFRGDYIAQQLSEAFNIKLDIDYRCNVSSPNNDERHKAKLLLQDNGRNSDKPYVVFAPFAKTELDVDDKFVLQGMQYISQKYEYNVVLVNANKTEQTDRIIRAADNLNVIDLSGKTTLMEMVAILDEAKLVISTDSAPMHIACAMGTNTIAIFSSGNATRWMPRNNCNLVSLDLPCSPCLEKKQCLHKSCMKGITWEMLREKIDKVLVNKIVL